MNCIMMNNEYISNNPSDTIFFPIDVCTNTKISIKKALYTRGTYWTCFHLVVVQKEFWLQYKCVLSSS